MANLETFEYSPQTETYETGWGAETEWGGEAEVFSEAETMELAGELTEITTEAELDRFLGDLISKAGRALGKVVRSPIGQAVGGWLKGAAKSALPLAGGALGGLVGGPLGAKIGSGLASAAGSALGLEAEMSQEDREFEGAKNFVKMAADAVKSAVTAAPGANPVAVAKAAVKAGGGKTRPWARWRRRRPWAPWWRCRACQQIRPHRPMGAPRQKRRHRQLRMGRLRVQRRALCVTSIQGLNCDRTHLNFPARRMADPLSVPGLDAPSATLKRMSWPWNCFSSQAELSSSGLLAVFSRKHGGASSRSGRKSLGLSGGSSRRSSRRRCLPW